jgi:oxygen-independent coproporphyrinogen-3 oxidase
MRSAPDVDQLLALDRPSPRYTSYPTVPAWTPDVGDDDLAAGISALDAPVSVYVHVPFCKEQCWFCGCNQVVSARQDAGDKYLDRLEVEVAALGRSDLQVARLHLGGGTPTWLTVPQLERLFGLVDRLGARVPGAEVSIELDPDVTSVEQIDRLAELGATRLSVGVQSTDPRVLAAIHRPQDTARVRACLERARHHGMRGLNVDLVYGLPYQDRDNVRTTVTDVLAHAPDRLAIYSYAHVPWSKRHQANIDASLLPGPVDKLGLFLLAEELLLDAGYVRVGMDHFARADDELAVAARDGVLHRNFMGYTTRADLPVVGLGVSAISELPGLYAQQEPHLAAWYRAVDADAAIVHKTCMLTDDDRLRSDVIAGIMCNLAVDVRAVEREHHVDFAQVFADALIELRPLQDQGFVQVSGDSLRVTEAGRLVLRNVAMCFDGWLGKTNARFSQTV